MMLGARTAALAKSGGGVPNARDYVQDGLIAMWDGIENAGWGVHNANAPVWKDLIGGVGDMHFFVSGDGTRTETGKHMSNDGMFYYSDGTDMAAAPDSNGILPNVFGGNFTIEYFRKARNDLIYSQTYGLSWINTTYCTDYITISYATWLRNLSVNVGDLNNKIKLGALNTIVDRGSHSLLILNGEEIKDVYNEKGSAIFYDSRGDHFGNGNMSFRVFSNWIGVNNSNPSVGIGVGRIAIYNRDLTSIEIAENYAIDKARFGLT